MNHNPAPDLQEPVPVPEEKQESNNIPEAQKTRKGTEAQKTGISSEEKKSCGEKLPDSAPAVPGAEAEKRTEEGPAEDRKGGEENPAEEDKTDEKGSEVSQEPASVGLPDPKSCKGRKLTGRLMIALGLLLILSAVLLYVYNVQEDQKAGEAAAEMLPQVQQEILEKVQEKSESSTEATEASVPEHVNPYNHEQVEASREMTVWTHNGWIISVIFTFRLWTWNCLC